MATLVRNQKQVLNEMKQKSGQLRIHCRGLVNLFRELQNADTRTLPSEIIAEFRQDIVFASKMIAQIEQGLVLDP